MFLTAIFGLVTATIGYCSASDALDAAAASAQERIRQILPTVGAASANDAATAMSNNPGYLCRLEGRISPDPTATPRAYSTFSFCVGTLVNPNTVLTSGVCVGSALKKLFNLYNGNGKINVVCGDVNSRWTSNTGTRKSIQFDLNTDRISRPSGYDSSQAEDSTGSPKPYNRDMALLHLSQSFTANSETNPASAKVSKSGATSGSTQKMSILELTTDYEYKLTGSEMEVNTISRYASDSVVFETSCPVSSSGLICYKVSSSQPQKGAGSLVILGDNTIGGIVSTTSQDGTLVYVITDLWNFRMKGTMMSQALQFWRSLLPGK